jgi:uncharacterized protein (TIGR01777 family)
MVTLASESQNNGAEAETKQSMVVAVTGATGLVGSAVCKAFGAAGDRIMRLGRSPSIGSIDEILWNPEDGISNTARLERTDTIVHLAGESIANGRWTSNKKERIHNSRVRGTHKLCEQIAEMERPPQVLVCASAIGYYGDRGNVELTEQSEPGSGFLADVCREWEAATQPASDRGVRVVNLRIGVVLSRKGGALAQMLTPFRMGVGGRIGSGRQYWSWVHLDDVVGAIRHCIEHPDLRGAVNCVSPTPVTNLEFTKTLGKVLARPTILPMPRIGARLVLGQMANDLLLASTRVVPKRLTETGYQFARPDLVSALREELATSSVT